MWRKLNQRKKVLSASVYVGDPGLLWQQDCALGSHNLLAQMITSPKHEPKQKQSGSLGSELAAGKWQRQQVNGSSCKSMTAARF